LNVQVNKTRRWLSGKVTSAMFDTDEAVSPARRNYMKENILVN
jgi:hypothetical protein